MTINEAIAAYAAEVQRISNEYYAKHFTRLQTPTITTEKGKRYCRIVISDETHRSVHSFVDLTNGDILKAACWKAPYTKGPKPARGNVFSLSEGGFNQYGAEYRR